MNSRRRMDDLPRCISGDYRGSGCLETGLSTIRLKLDPCCDGLSRALEAGRGAATQATA
jgi:hypothetical protein